MREEYIEILKDTSLSITKGLVFLFIIKYINQVVSNKIEKIKNDYNVAFEEKVLQIIKPMEQKINNYESTMNIKLKNFCSSTGVADTSLCYSFVDFKPDASVAAPIGPFISTSIETVGTRNNDKISSEHYNLHIPKEEKKNDLQDQKKIINSLKQKDNEIKKFCETNPEAEKIWTSLSKAQDSNFLYDIREDCVSQEEIKISAKIDDNGTMYEVMDENAPSPFYGIN
jgi:hypothetical protein